MSERATPTASRKGIKVAPRRLSEVEQSPSSNEPKIHKPQNTPESARNILLQTLGGVVAFLVDEPRYRGYSIADLQFLILEPLVNDRIQLVKYAKPASGSAPEMAAVAIWASVSKEVDTKIRGQISAGVFPVRLLPDDWTSGNIDWLLDVVTHSQDVANRVITGFSQVTKSDKLNLHPQVIALLDNATLKKLVTK